MTDREWYSYGEIRFSRSQILWLIMHLEFAPDGWPPEYKESGYVGGKSSRKQRAPFEMPACIWAELRKRIEATGQNGLWMEIVYSNPENYPWQIQHIANAMRFEYRTIERRIHTALRYVTGRRRKAISYREFRERKRKRPE